jgi:beta-N-acetylhexosaminidase
VLKNLDGLIPIPTNVKSVFVIAPPDNLGLDAVLSAELQTRGLQVQFAHYNAPWLGNAGDNAMLESFATQAAGYDLVLVFTWQAHANRLLYGNTWQGDMVNAIQQSGTPLIVASLKSPTDVLEFPTVKAHVASFGTTTGQIQGLVDVLTKTSAVGINPLPNLP